MKTDFEESEEKAQEQGYPGIFLSAMVGQAQTLPVMAF